MLGSNKNIFTSYGIQIFAMLCSFVSGVLVARMCGVNGQGEYALYLSFTAMSILVLGLGFPAAVTHHIAANKTSKKNLLLPFILLQIFFSLLVYLLLEFNVLFSLFNFLLPSFLLQHSVWIGICSIYIFFMLLNQLLQSILQAEMKFALNYTIQSICAFVLMSIYILKYFNIFFTTYEAIYFIIFAMLAVQLLQSFLYLIYLFKNYRLYFSFKKISFDIIRQLFLFSLIAFAANVIQFLNYKSDIWLLNYFHADKNIIGIYAVATTLTQLLWLLPNVVQGILYSHFSKEKILSRKIFFTHLWLKRIFIYALLCGIAGYVFSIFAVPYLYGKDFANTITYIGILLIGVVPFSVAIVYAAFMGACGMLKYNMYASIYGLIINMILNLCWIPQYNATGAAWASVASYIAMTIYYVYLFEIFKKGKMNFKSEMEA